MGKIVKSTPYVVFDYVFSLLREYSNFIPIVTDAVRYFSDLEFDILNFSLLEDLSGRGRNDLKRIGADGMSVNSWLRNLSTFVGVVCRKQERMDLEPILQYVANQLVSGSIYDLRVLQELISGMNGTRIQDDLTVEQLDAIAGGEVLRREAFGFENLKVVRKSAVRLAGALRGSGLVAKIAVLIAVRKMRVVFERPDNEPLKVVAWLSDVVCTCASFLCFVIANVDGMWV